MLALPSSPAITNAVLSDAWQAGASRRFRCVIEYIGADLSKHHYLVGLLADLKPFRGVRSLICQRLRSTGRVLSRRQSLPRSPIPTSAGLSHHGRVVMEPTQIVPRVST